MTRAIGFPPVFLIFLLASIGQQASGQFGGADPFGDAVVGDPFGGGAPASRPATATASKKADKDDSETIVTKSRRPALEPDSFRITLMDGMEIIGKLSVPEIQVETNFGTLDVPITMIRTLTPGLESHAELQQQILQSIEDLAADSVAQRDLAQRELLQTGQPIREQLSEYLDDNDKERARRIKLLLDEIDEAAEELDEFDGEAAAEQWHTKDTVETTKFTMRGKIYPQSFDVTSKYGVISIDLADIESIEGATEEVAEDVQKTLTLTGEYLAQLKFKSTAIRVEPGDRIVIHADGSINRSGSSSYVSTPDGSSRFGTYSANIIGGTLVARIGSRGDVIKAGSKLVLNSKKSGVLQFAIGMRPDYVGRYQFQGQYNVKVKVVRGEP